MQLFSPRSLFIIIINYESFHPRFFCFIYYAYIYYIIKTDNIMALLKNHKGEYNYQFNWVDCDGHTCGFNDVWASNKREAVKKAKAMESPARWAWYDGKTYITVPAEVTTGGHCFYNKGMYVDVKSMYKATAKQADDMNRLGWMMSN